MRSLSSFFFVLALVFAGSANGKEYIYTVKEVTEIRSAATNSIGAWDDHNVLIGFIPSHGDYKEIQSYKQSWQKKDEIILPFCAHVSKERRVAMVDSLTKVMLSHDESDKSKVTTSISVCGLSTCVVKGNVHCISGLKLRRD